MTTVFLSYRRNDAADATGRLQEHLRKRVSSIHIFKDVDNIPYGSDFLKTIQDALKQTDVLLAVIGPNWLESKDAHGSRRILDPADFVRIELEAAFAAGIRVIPVLVGNATMPAASDLPPTIQRLALCNAAPVRPDPDFQNDLNRLASAIGRKKRSIVWIAVASLVCLMVLTGYLVIAANRPPFKPGSPTLKDEDISEHLMPLIGMVTSREAFTSELDFGSDLPTIRNDALKQIQEAQDIEDALNTRAQRFAFDETETFSRLQGNLEKKKVLLKKIVSLIDAGSFTQESETIVSVFRSLKEEFSSLVIKYSEYLKRRGITPKAEKLEEPMVE